MKDNIYLYVEMFKTFQNRIQLNSLLNDCFLFLNITLSCFQRKIISRSILTRQKKENLTNIDTLD